MYRILEFINRNTKDFINSLIILNLEFGHITTLYIIVNLTMFRINF